MATEFEPFVNEINRNAFSALEFEVTQDEVPQAPDEQQELLVEIERLKQEAIDQGYTEGLQKAQAEIDARMNELHQWIELIQKPALLLDNNLTQEIIHAMIWICTHCIGVEISSNPDKLYALLEHVKNELPTIKGNNHFCMHPDDIAWIHQESMQKLIPDLQTILTADPELSRGDFYLKGDNSELDGRIATRVNALFAQYITEEPSTTPSKPLE